ncbi:MAG: hypothetical protein NZ746_03530 [Blastocatellia bacterium]|nr:hypothetical protein [Blastocatellia bacterium]MDW8257294.1 hypothetical protein [Acidobacteriota bacterium]
MMRKLAIAGVVLLLVRLGSPFAQTPSSPSATRPESKKPAQELEPLPVTAPGSDVTVFAPGRSIARDYLRGGIVLGRALLRPTLEVGLEGDSNFLTLAETRGARNGIFAIAPGVDLEVPALRSGFRLTYAPLIRVLRIAELPSSNVAHRLDVDFTTRLGPAVTLAVRDHWTKATFDTLEFDPGREIFFNAKPFWRNDLAVRAEYAVTERDRLSAHIGLNRVELSGPPRPDDLFFDYTTLTVALAYARRWRPRHTLQFDVEIGRTHSRRAENARDPRLNDARLLQVGATLRSRLMPTLRAEVQVAARRHRFPRAARNFFGPYLAVALEREFGHRLTLSISGMRTTVLSAFNPEEGNAFALTAGLSATLTQRIGPRLTWAIGAEAQRLSFPVPIGLDSSFGGVPLWEFVGVRRTDRLVGTRAEITFRLHELLAVQVGYIFYERGSTITPFSFERSRFKMGVVLGRWIPGTAARRF